MPLSDSMLVIVVSMLLKSTLFGKRHRKVLRDNIHSAICAPGRSQTHIWTDVRGDPVRAHKNAPQYLIRCCCQQIRQTPRLCELLLSRKRNNRVYLPRKVNNRRTQYGGDVVRNQVSEIPAWACSCCTQEGRSAYAEIASQDCYVLSVARKMYTPTGDEQQAIRMHVPKNHKSRRMLLYPAIRVRAIVLPWMLLLPLSFRGSGRRLAMSRRTGSVLPSASWKRRPPRAATAACARASGTNQLTTLPHPRPANRAPPRRESAADPKNRSSRESYVGMVGVLAGAKNVEAAISAKLLYFSIRVVQVTVMCEYARIKVYDFNSMESEEKREW